MTVEPTAGTPLAETALGRRDVPKRVVVIASARVVALVGLTLLVYRLLPIEESTGFWVAVSASVALVALGVAFVVLLSRISRSPNPLVAGIEALSLVFGLFLCLFAFIYVSLSAIDSEAFSAPIDKVAGIYFSMTILATVGFGDISAASHAARIAVTFQMVLDMVLIGAALKLLAGATRRAVERAGAGAGAAGTDGTSIPGSKSSTATTSSTEGE